MKKQYKEIINMYGFDRKNQALFISMIGIVSKG
jgi:hypothetical protein